MADEKKPGVVERAKSRFKVAVDAESTNREKQVDDLKFLAASPDDNFQWPREILQQRTLPGQEGGPRPCLTINKLPQHHRQVTNEQRMNRPQIRVQPVDDKGDPEVAKIYNGITRHIQVASEADLAYDLACDSQVACGEGYFRILTDYCDEKSFDQDILIAPIADRFKVYLDPVGLLQHPAGRKCRWGFVIEDLPKDEYARQYDENPIDWREAARGDQSDWFPNKETVRIAEYFEIEEKKKKLYLFQVGEEFVPMLEGEPLPAGVNAGQKPVKDRDTSVPQCRWYKLNGQEVIDERDMPTKYIPIIRVIGNQWIIEGKPIISGIIRNAKDAQRMYNYNASLDVEQNALAPKAPFVGMAEQFKGHEARWKKANTIPYAYLPYNAVVDPETGQIVTVQAPQRVQPAMPNAAIIEAKLAASDDIKATTGQYDASLGQRSNETSGKAINARKVESDVGTFHYVDNLARAIRYAGTIIVDMIPRVYDAKRIARILGEDGEADHVVLDPKQPEPYKEVKGANGKMQKVYNLGVGKYDVIVSVGPSFTTKRAEAAEFLTNAVQSAKDPATANVLTYLALKSQDWAGADEAVTMLKKLLPPNVLPPENEGDPMADLPPEVAAAMQQLKAMAGGLQGQLDAAKQALAQRDQALAELQSESKNKKSDALVKMYEADKKAMAEIEKARADVMIARAEAATAAAAQPANAELQGVLQGLDQVLGEMNAKIVALAQSTATIAEQLEAFEIAARMPAEPAPVAP